MMSFAINTMIFVLKMMLLGPHALIYTNECANHEITEVPKEFDLISVRYAIILLSFAISVHFIFLLWSSQVDVYAGFKPGVRFICKNEDSSMASEDSSMILQ